MSPTMPASAAMTARAARQLQKKITASLTGRSERGPDRHVRRDSYDVEDPRAKPWRPVGGGSVGEGLAHREALLQAGRELYRQQWRELPASEVREARQRYDALSAELDTMLAAGAAPTGRPALLRQEIAKLRALLERARMRLRRVDLTVLEALLEKVDFATGRLFPSIDTIAAAAGCHRNSVNAAKARLKAHGFIAWVRRSLKTGNEREFAPQREQTSNAYFFDHRAGMTPRVWQRFCQLLVARLRRLGPKRPAAGTPGAAGPQDPGLREVLAALGAAVANAST